MVRCIAALAVTPQVEARAKVLKSSMAGPKLVLTSIERYILGRFELFIGWRPVLAPLLLWGMDYSNHPQADTRAE